MIFDIDALSLLFSQQPNLFLTYIIILGLLVGSFLNVVIYRLPEMMKRQWKTECTQYLASLELSDTNEPTEQPFTNDEESTFNLIFPRSHCPSCDAPVKAWMNIPVLSYLMLLGRCANCKTRISIRYPLLEIFTSAVSGAVAWKFGFGWECAAILILSWSLICLTMIDFDHQLLPDSITLPLLWLGLICNYFGLFTSLENALLGAIFGYLSLWSIYWIFKIITGKEGMGYGDFKLLSALGAFLGWKMLLPIILLSSLSGTVVGLLLILNKKNEASQAIAFGPYLALGGFLCIFFGEPILKIIGW